MRRFRPSRPPFRLSKIRSPSPVRCRRRRLSRLQCPGRRGGRTTRVRRGGTSASGEAKQAAPAKPVAAAKPKSGALRSLATAAAVVLIVGAIGVPLSRLWLGRSQESCLWRRHRRSVQRPRRRPRRKRRRFRLSPRLPSCRRCPRRVRPSRHPRLHRRQRANPRPGFLRNP